MPKGSVTWPGDSPWGMKNQEGVGCWSLLSDEDTPMPWGEGTEMCPGKGIDLVAAWDAAAAHHTWRLKPAVVVSPFWRPGVQYRCLQGHPPSETCRGEAFLAVCLVVIISHGVPWADSCCIAIPAPPIITCILPGVSLPVSPLLLQGAQS